MRRNDVISSFRLIHTYSPAGMTDQELIPELITGQQAAYRELAERYREPVVRTCYSFVHDHLDAEDIAQEVFLEVFRSISSFKGNSGIGTWIYRIAVNKSLNFIRKKKRNSLFGRIEDLFRGNFASEPVEDAYANAEALGAEEEKKKTALYRSIDSLPKNQRMAFVLHKYNELSYKEIAVIMNVSLSAVESLMHRAKINLQKNIVKHYQSTLNDRPLERIYMQ